MSLQGVRNPFSLDNPPQILSLMDNFIDLNYESFYNLLLYLSEFLNFKEAYLFVKKLAFLSLKYSYPNQTSLSGIHELRIPPKILNDLFKSEGIKIINSSDRIRKYFRFLDRKKDLGLLLFPLKKNDIHLGLIIFSQFKDNSYRSFDYSKVKNILFQFNFLSYSSFLIDKEVRKSKLIENINNICHNLESFLNEEDLFKNLVRCIQENLKYDHVGLYLVDRKKKKIVLKAIAGKYENYVPRNQELDFDTGIVGQVIRSGKTILSNNTRNNPHFFNLTPDITPTLSELCVPISIENEIIGAINIESTKLMEFDHDDLNSLEVLANRLGTKIYNNQLFNEIKRSNKRLYDIVSSMGQGIILLDNKFKITWVNNTIKKWYGDDLINRDCANSICSKKFFNSDCPGRITSKTGKITQRMIKLTDGRYFNVTSAPIKEMGTSNNQIVELFDDITSNIDTQVRLDEIRKQLEQTKYLAALGELTTSIAHEIRNPLNSISNAISIFDHSTALDRENLIILNIIKEETKRLNNIISKYLQFRKFPEICPSLNDIKVSIIQIIHLIKLDKKLASRIEFITEFDPDVPKFLFDQEAIKQVLWNLIINSISAIRTKGFVKISVNKSGKNIIVSIEDNGIGISKKRINNIFNQFYSLKKNGLGMGLSIVKRIIEKHEWSIEINSIYKKGTVFKIIIPLN